MRAVLKSSCKSYTPRAMGCSRYKICNPKRCKGYIEQSNKKSQEELIAALGIAYEKRYVLEEKIEKLEKELYESLKIELNG